MPGAQLTMSSEIALLVAGEQPFEVFHSETHQGGQKLAGLSLIGICLQDFVKSVVCGIIAVRESTLFSPAMKSPERVSTRSWTTFGT